MSATLTELPKRTRTNASEFNQIPEEIMTPNPKAGIVATMQHLTTPDRSNHHHHITGLRGILVAQSFFWTYFQTFIPTLTSNATSGPVYQDLIRDIFCVPLWNESLIYNFFIILSMRTIAVSFLRNPSGQTYAATVIRRIIRMVLLLCAGSGMATLIFSQIGTQYIEDFKANLPNQSIQTPMETYDAGSAISSMFNLFWLTSDFYTQAANNFWPTATLWVPSIMYFQSFTTYFLMVILPFTRPQWHIQGLALFALGSLWMGYWGWYSATGLFLADLATNTVLKSELKLGLKVRNDWRLPYWAVAMTLAAVGIALKYVVIVQPQYTNSELVLRPFLDLAENFSRESYVEKGPYARVDDWLIIVGVMIAVEYFEDVQYYLSLKPLVWLGERSFSVFVAQSVFFWTGGIKLWLVLHDDKGMNTAGANAVVIVVGLLAIMLFSESFYRLVDLPSKWVARETHLWLLR